MEYCTYIFKIYGAYVDKIELTNICMGIWSDKYFWIGGMGTEEDKHAKFRELAEKRTNKALDSIRLIGNLSNRQTYVFEEVEVRKIVKALKEAVAEVETRFSKTSGRSGGEFKL